MQFAIDLTSQIHAFRKETGVKVRTPFKIITYKASQELSGELTRIILDETNAYKLIYKGKSARIQISADKSPDNQDQAAGRARDIIRQIQVARKEANCDLAEIVTVKLPDWPKEFEEEIKKQTLSSKLEKSGKLEIVRN